MGVRAHDEKENSAARVGEFGWHPAPLLSYVASINGVYRPAMGGNRRRAGGGEIINDRR